MKMRFIDLHKNKRAGEACFHIQCFHVKTSSDTEEKGNTETAYWQQEEHEQTKSTEIH